MTMVLSVEISLIPVSLHLLMTYVFRFHISQIYISYNPGHIIINRHRYCPHTFGNQPCQPAGRMVFPVPGFSHFRRIFSSTSVTANGLPIIWRSRLLRSSSSRCLVPFPMTKARTGYSARRSNISFSYRAVGITFSLPGFHLPLPRRIRSCLFRDPQKVSRLLTSSLPGRQSPAVPGNKYPAVPLLSVHTGLHILSPSG